MKNMQPPLFRWLYYRDYSFYRCYGFSDGRAMEDCWRIGPMSITFRPLYLWRLETGNVFEFDGWREIYLDLFWVSFLWMPEGDIE